MIHYVDCPIYAWAFNVTSSLQDLRTTFCMYFSNPLSHVLRAPLQLLFISVFMCIYLFAYDTFRIGVGMSHRGVMIWLVRNQLAEMRKETTVVCFYVIARNLRGRTEEIRETLGLACVSPEKQTGHLQNRSRHRSVLSN